MKERLRPIVMALTRLTNRVTSEYDLQRAVAALLPAAKPEAVLTRTERVDFLVDGIGIECKVDGTAVAIARQLLRYEPHVDAIILITTKPLPDFPREAFTKPLIIITPWI